MIQRGRTFNVDRLDGDESTEARRRALRAPNDSMEDARVEVDRSSASQTATGTAHNPDSALPPNPNADDCGPARSSDPAHPDGSSAGASNTAED